MYKFYFEQYCGPGCCTSQESTKTTEEFYSINISLLLPQIISFLEDYCYEDLFDNVNIKSMWENEGYTKTIKYLKKEIEEYDLDHEFELYIEKIDVVGY